MEGPLWGVRKWGEKMWPKRNAFVLYNERQCIFTIHWADWNRQAWKRRTRLAFFCRINFSLNIEEMSTPHTHHTCLHTTRLGKLVSQESKKKIWRKFRMPDEAIISNHEPLSLATIRYYGPCLWPQLGINGPNSWLPLWIIGPCLWPPLGIMGPCPWPS